MRVDGIGEEGIRPRHAYQSASHDFLYEAAGPVTSSHLVIGGVSDWLIGCVSD